LPPCAVATPSPVSLSAIASCSCRACACPTTHPTPAKRADEDAAPGIAPCSFVGAVWFGRSAIW
jgi:hypothetical protein